MKKTKQLKIWKSKFGKDYTDRNILSPDVRINAFKRMVSNLDIKKILEVGCGSGHNLITLSKIGKYKLIGIEPQEYAVKKAKESSDLISVLEGDCFEIPSLDSHFDLVFTCGVLIHISKEDLARTIDEIYRVSNKYILAIEYYAPEETVIHYRGYDDLLWKRDFKKIFLQQKPDLKCIKEGFWNAKEGFDDCHWWLFEKQQKKIAAIVQVRLTSTRLPGKVLMDIAGKPMLWHVINRLKYSKKLGDIILAIPNTKENDILEKFAKENKVKYFRGSEEDVLSRYYETAKSFECDIMVNITSDCPLIDPRVVDLIIKRHLSSNTDYTSNILKRTFPRGLDTEVFNFEILEKIQREVKEPYQREHVTLYIRQYPERFNVQNIIANKKLRRPELRLTVDTKEDLKLIREIYRHLYKPKKIFTTEEFIDFLDKNPELKKINAHIKQKSVHGKVY